MLKDAEKKQFTVVLVWKQDRFMRNRYESATDKMKLKIVVFYSLRGASPITFETAQPLIEEKGEEIQAFSSSQKFGFDGRCSTKKSLLEPLPKSKASGEDFFIVLALCQMLGQAEFANHKKEKGKTRS